MKTSSSRRHPAGYVSFLLVLATGSILTLLMIYAYRRALNAQVVEAQVQLRLDYSEKEEAILRAIVAITPNRAIRAMQSGSNVSGTRGALRWKGIFTESLDLANARTSIPSNVLASLNLTNYKTANTGNATLSSPDRIFNQIGGVNDDLDTSYASAGINRSLGTGYPVPLTTDNSTTIDRDRSYPIISKDKQYGTLAQTGVGLPVATYPEFNLLPYPNINFGYAKPGEPFVAKRNWWAFSVDVADHENDKTNVALSRRNFVLSIYEIPSQLSISAASFMSLGQYASGAAWQNYNIDGGMFVGKANVTGTTPLKSLAIRRSMTLSSGTTIGGETFTSSPFAPGVREAYQVTKGAFFPVSLASESGRATFIPISRGANFFDRFDSAENDPIEASGALNHYGTDVLSPTSWNNYSIGAQQCAMRVDITQVQSPTDSKPTMLRFQYFMADGNTRAELPLPVIPDSTSLPRGYVEVCSEGGSYTFAEPVDLAYGHIGGYAYREGLSGPITFDDDTFGDPLPGNPILKKGYWRPRVPYETKPLASGQVCVAVYPQRIPAFLSAIGAAGPAINNSLVVNVDYTSTGLFDVSKKPSIPCRPTYSGDPLVDYGAILNECRDLRSFPKGFSLVTNLRLFVGDDFNIVPTTPRTGYTPEVTLSNPEGFYYPPCSLFSPEKRFGVEVDAPWVSLKGQIGSLASDTVTNPVHPLDAKNMSGNAMTGSQIKVNLSQIRDPSELPPITMMNWLVLLEERRR